MINATPIASLSTLYGRRTLFIQFCMRIYAVFPRQVGEIPRYIMLNKKYNYSASLLRLFVLLPPKDDITDAPS